MKISVIEEACRKAGLKPVHREKMEGFDVFIADGFSKPPHTAFHRFGIDKHDFIFGCWVTMWALARGDDHFQLAAPVFFEKNHDPEYDDAMRERMRVNSAMQDAARNLAAMSKRVLLNG